MDLLKNMTIRRKLITMVMVTSGAAVLLSSGFSLYFSIYNHKKDLVRDLSVHAQVTGVSSSEGLMFEMSEEVELILSGLTAKPSITNACIYAASGKAFAYYKRDKNNRFVTPSLPDKNQHTFTKTHFEIFHYIIVKGERIGAVYLEDDMSQLNADIKKDITIVLFVIVLSLFAAYIMTAKFVKVFSEPIIKLTTTAILVTETKDFSTRVTHECDDEIGLLIKSFNEMINEIESRDVQLNSHKTNLEKLVQDRTSELEETHDKLVESARQAGKAEVATSVLHNVGNVLNSVNVSATVIFNKMRLSKLSGLIKAKDMINKNIDNIGPFIANDSKGSQLPNYITKVAELMESEQEDIKGEISSLISNIEHINEIISVQQAHGKLSGVIIALNLSKLVEDAFKIQEESMIRSGIEIVKHYADLPDVNVDKQKVLQIVINLITNAKHAVEAIGKSKKSVEVITLVKNDRLFIHVKDNGVGISAENLSKVFNHGFTTKKDGHGFGLHSCALAAKDMGGTLTPFSDGEGEGATFTLELPYNPANTAASTVT